MWLPEPDGQEEHEDDGYPYEGGEEEEEEDGGPGQHQRLQK